MPLLKCTIITEGLDTDLTAIEIDVNKKIPSALRLVGSEMQNSLIQHLEEDWYRGYTPMVYMRRTDYPSLGTSIMDKNTMDIVVDGNLIEFAYTPTAPNWEPFEGNALIGTIQTGHLFGNPPPRPFWNNFVEEMENGGISGVFKAAMLPYKVEFAAEELDLSEALITDSK